MTSTSRCAYLIVNADDYGYFNCVSKGILHSASQGIVTTTGIFANSTHFTEHVEWLKDSPHLDLGVHLNITDQSPLTDNMRNRLTCWNGRFPDKYTISRALLTGRLKIEDVRTEWRAQIERCIDGGLHIQFLNSHEHIHMLPPLFPVLQSLAREYGISHIRFPTSEPFHDLSFGALARDILIKGLGLFNRPRLTYPVAHFLGMDKSGKLNLEYLMRILPRLKSGNVYELMCHPGFYDENEVRDSRLPDYHDWHCEFDALTNPQVRDILDQHQIRLIGYRNLLIQNGQFIVQDT